MANLISLTARDLQLLSVAVRARDFANNDRSIAMYDGCAQSSKGEDTDFIVEIVL